MKDVIWGSPWHSEKRRSKVLWTRGEKSERTNAIQQESEILIHPLDFSLLHLF